jgi:hypothetical protein
MRQASFFQRAPRPGSAMRRLKMPAWHTDGACHRVRNMTSIDALNSFEALLQAARQQDQPQRLLMVFVQKKVDAQASADQRETFERGEGGYLEPCLVVDKAPDEIASFAALGEE